MKKIIEGKVYDTETPQKIASWDNGSNFFETLYKTKKGEWFLCGCGGPMSKWSKSNGNTTCGGSGIITLSEKKALFWCEDNEIDADIIIKNFKTEEA